MLDRRQKQRGIIHDKLCETRELIIVMRLRNPYYSHRTLRKSGSDTSVCSRRLSSRRDMSMTPSMCRNMPSRLSNGGCGVVGQGANMVIF